MTRRPMAEAEKWPLYIKHGSKLPPEWRGAWRAVELAPGEYEELVKMNAEVAAATGELYTGRWGK